MTLKAHQTVQLIDSIICKAIQKNASDIHFEIYETIYRIRVRVNGVLNYLDEIPIKMANTINTRIKVLANLDISERRLPQDGHFEFIFNEISTNIRVSTCPTLHGEKIILRILKNRHDLLALDQLGLLEDQLNLLLEHLRKPEGLILVTGPTGCGKTSTLYSALTTLNTNDVNIVSVEDPIEIPITGINQVNILPKIGLTFERVLRGFLRQDPDIIMIGEIRDHETAQVSIKAANTGHLVLATLHTDSVIGSFHRLLHLGLQDYEILESIKLIINQRLIKKLCLHCRTVNKNNKLFLAGLGCEHCQNGYSGRTGVFELLSLDKSTIESLYTQNFKSILEKIKTLKFKRLNDIANIKLHDGIFSLNEINRVLVFN
ncbi:MAG: GspE/PulE family protein [Gammaproteobacteria bacterium]